MYTAATPEQLQARLGLRQSSAAQPHKNKYLAVKKPGKADRKTWKKEAHV